MQIITINDETIAAGKAAFQDYKATAMCGRDTLAYDMGLYRQQGMGVVVGAIIACIENGLRLEEEVVTAVARVSRCHRSTVFSILTALTGSEPSKHFWRKDADGYRLLQRAANDADSPVTLIAA